MKKIVLPAVALVALAAAPAAQAQANLVHGIGAGISLLRMAARNKAAAQLTSPTPSLGTYRGQQFPMQRTPVDQLPKQGAEQVKAVETQLDRFHAALLADSTRALGTPEQRTALHTALVNLARTQSHGSQQAYQQEATFYLAEDTRRQQAAAGTAPGK